MTINAEIHAPPSIDVDIGGIKILPSGLPAGGEKGQVLTKQSNADNDADWDDLPVFDGVYEITPLVGSETTMRTQQHYLDRNIVVKSIPYAEVTNEANGLTATIGG